MTAAFLEIARHGAFVAVVSDVLILVYAGHGGLSRALDLTVEAGHRAFMTAHAANTFRRMTHKVIRSHIIC